MTYYHEPVMLKEVIEYLKPKPGQVIVDCTLGGAGYTQAMAESVGSKGKVLAIDVDEMAIENAKKVFKENKLKNVILSHANFRSLQEILEQNGVAAIDGLVADLGLSSAQLQDRKRGFSFGLDTPLVMSFDGSDREKTLNIVNNYSKENLEKIIKDFGEEKYAGRIAGAIVQTRRSSETMHSERRSAPVIRSARQLAEIIFAAVPTASQRGRIHPATRTFQALRIATNDELSALSEMLAQALKVLRPGGVIVVLSYHSGEDRIVKNFFRQETKECICPPQLPICQCSHQASLRILTKKVVVAGVEEIKKNPRSRSAKLRAAEKI